MFVYVCVCVCVRVCVCVCVCGIHMHTGVHHEWGYNKPRVDKRESVELVISNLTY